MFEVKLNVQDKGFLARLRAIPSRLFKAGRRAEQKVNKDLNEGKTHVYEDDASESLAMALGKRVDKVDKVDVADEFEW